MPAPFPKSTFVPKSRNLDPKFAAIEESATFDDDEEDDRPKKVEKKPKVEQFESETNTTPTPESKPPTTTLPPEKTVVSFNPKAAAYQARPPPRKLEVKKLEMKTFFKPEFVFGADTSKFENMGLTEKMIQCLKDKLNITTPTLIQQKSIPPLVQKNDCLVKAETGSGKTLCYLLPVFHDLCLQEMHRDHGTVALILSPTRELCLQILETTKKLCQVFHWLVPGILIGGEKKKSEKARLRKGVNILICTPGRLLDHLRTTQSFQLHNLKWLVFDEADRLLDMGFERDVTAIIDLLSHKLNPDATDAEPKKIHPQTVLCSATLDERVRKLAGISLQNPVLAAVDQSHDKDDDQKGEEGKKEVDPFDEYSEKYLVPKTLKQFYSVVPCKRRLSSLALFLRTISLEEKSGKTIVFFSNCDSVDFHHAILNGRRFRHTKSELYVRVQTEKDAKPTPMEEEENFANKKEKNLTKQIQVAAQTQMKKEKILKENEMYKADIQDLIARPIFRLHGNMTQIERKEVYSRFCDQSTSSILFCTNVAARGMDFPGVTWILQYEPPQETKEYIHRIGRTARLGKSGNAVMFLQDSEMEYLDIMKNHKLNLELMPIETYYKERNSELYVGSFLTKECESDAKLTEMATKAFISSMRAYGTHSDETKAIFNVRNLHLGHFAGSFGLTEPPSHIVSHVKDKQKKVDREMREKRQVRKTRQGSRNVEKKADSEFSSGF